MNQFRPTDDFEAAAIHEIWPCEAVGDLLVVTPKGDLVGFQSQGFQPEYNRVLRLARSPRFRNVLMDLSKARYFGSEMIGALVNLRSAVVEQAETVDKDTVAAPVEPAPQPAAEMPPTVEFLDSSDDPPLATKTTSGEPDDRPDADVLGLCNVSDDMQAGFQIMGVDQLWQTFPDRRSAEKALANVTLKDRFRRSRKFFVALACVLLIAAVLSLFTVPTFREAIFRPTASGDLALLESANRKWNRRMNARPTGEELARQAAVLRKEIRWWKRRLQRDDWSEPHNEVIQATLYLNEWMQDPMNEVSKDRYLRALQEARQGVDR